MKYQHKYSKKIFRPYIEIETVVAEEKRRNFFGMSGVFFAAAFLFIMSSYIGVEYALRAMLVQQAQSTGMDWAHHIESQLPQFSLIYDSKKLDGEAKNKKYKTKQAPVREEFIRLINGMLYVGNIYQVDVYNPDCYCDIRFGSYMAKMSGQYDKNHFPHLDASQHSHIHAAGDPIKKRIDGFSLDHETNLRIPSQGTIEHVFENRAGHSPRRMQRLDSDSYPVDLNDIRLVAKNLQSSIVIHKERLVKQPKIFAEVFHPVLVNGKLSYILRILVDQEDDNAAFTLVLYSGVFVILILVLLAFGYPALKLLRSSKEQRVSNNRARYLADHDLLTELWNRNALQTYAPSLLNECLEKGQVACLFLFNLNNFRAINEAHGSKVGDQFLCEISRRLSNMARNTGVVTRLSGDEFVVIFKNVDEDNYEYQNLLNFPAKIMTEITEQKKLVEVCVSAGVTKFPRDGETLEVLLRNLDLAREKAKLNDEQCVVEYEPHMGEEFMKKAELRVEFMQAIKKSQIIPYYQPVIDLSRGRVIGFEALARWDHPEKGILTPFIFEELMMEREVGALIGSLMLKKAAKDMKRWNAEGVNFKRIGLNVGEGDLLNPSFAQNVLKELYKNELMTKNLTIEITENCMFDGNKDAFVKQLLELKKAGCNIALDDFGTGFSSITQIKDIPCTALKIDKSFVREVVSSTEDQAIIRSLVQLGKDLEFTVVAEGVETIDQRDLLKELGCELAQGYLYSRPIPADEVPLVLEKLHHPDYEKDIEAAVTAA